MLNHDLVIKNGRIIDGTGNVWSKKDIGISDGKIKTIGFINENAKRVIDAKGMIVSPGFIDLHNHSDMTLLAYPNAESAIMQGITTAVVGNCGISMAPINPRNADLLKKYLGNKAGYFFIQEFKAVLGDKYYTIIKEIGVDLRLVQLQNEFSGLDTKSFKIKDAGSSNIAFVEKN